LIESHWIEYILQRSFQHLGGRTDIGLNLQQTPEGNITCM